jgi:hypothetical protein
MLAGGFGVWGHPACALSRFGARVSPWGGVLHAWGVGGLVWRLGTPGLRAVALRRAGVPVGVCVALGGVGGLVWRLGTPGLRAVALGARVSPWVFALHSGKAEWAALG